MSEQWKPPSADEIRGLIERVDGELREAERLRSHADERTRRKPFFPDRRRTPRIPAGRDREPSSGDTA
jgi:hypothetical protein